jgi:hypothetical protein
MLDSDVEVLKEGGGKEWGNQSCLLLFVMCWYVEWGNRAACLLFVMCWYVEWGKLTSDLNTVQMALWFVKDRCSYFVQ